MGSPWIASAAELTNPTSNAETLPENDTVRLT